MQLYNYLGIGFILRAFPHILLDIWAWLFKRKPHTSTDRGRILRQFASMNTPDAYDGYMAIVDADADWENVTPARSLLSFSFYRPTTGYRIRFLCPCSIDVG